VREFHFIREGQPGSELYTFVVPASTLLEIARVERFNEDPDHKGVQRQLHYSQAVRIRDAMRQPTATLAEPILGNLEGEWIVDKDTGVLMGNGGCYLSVDDGQQRIAALHLLSEEERGTWELKVTATIGIPYEQRVRMFLQQTKRLKIDSQLVLQLQDKTGLFPDNITAKAYNLGKQIATNHNSPLYAPRPNCRDHQYRKHFR
jgi:DGQHR domain-containing protein